jgi:acetyl-CoA carboxylase biotin carboxyl carrier protein
MDTKILKEITKIMKDHDLVELEVESGDLKVRLKKAQGPAPTLVHAVAAQSFAPAAAASAPVAAASAAAPIVDEFAGCAKIISPIPGTVYLKANPDAPLFVSVGATIDESKVVCLVEAMKVFNEIKPDAGVKGTIRKICVNDGQPVEYGTVLFLVG